MHTGNQSIAIELIIPVKAFLYDFVEYSTEHLQ